MRKKRTVGVIEHRIAQTITWAMALTFGHLYHDWTQVIAGVVLYGLIMWAFTALER